ncbi:ferritin-like domain-containing protein [Bradyrhizobium sp. USDA 10063]
MTNGIDLGVSKWTLPSLQSLLQDAIDLEFWTIPYYLSAMYSIRDPASNAYQLIQSAVYQEMLHAQLVCNLTNAFGGLPTFTAPVYGGPKIPHLDFKLDTPDPTRFFTPYSTDIGPLDLERINTMCLIEYPQWPSPPSQLNVLKDRTKYGSIGALYAAIRSGVTALRDDLRGGVRQVDYFGSYYNNLPTTTITSDGLEGYRQAIELLDAIVEQGEGKTQGDSDVRVEYQNTADGFNDGWPHYRKFVHIRGMTPYPATFLPDRKLNAAGLKAQQILVRDFVSFIGMLNEMFQGKPYQGFGPLMAKLGGEVLNCWQHNAVPKFS